MEAVPVTHSGEMKTLGIVGGIGPESTIEYYRFILDGCRARVILNDGEARRISSSTASM